MTWRHAAQRIDTGIATMLASVTDGSVTSAEARKAVTRLEVDVAEMIALVDIELTPTEELREIVTTCEAFSARLAEFERRAEATLAVIAAIEHQDGDGAAVA